MCFVVIPFLDAISSVCPLDNFPSGFCRIDGVLYCRIGEPHSFVGCARQNSRPLDHNISKMLVDFQVQLCVVFRRACLKLHCQAVKPFAAALFGIKFSAEESKSPKRFEHTLYVKLLKRKNARQVWFPNQTVEPQALSCTRWILSVVGDCSSSVRKSTRFLTNPNRITFDRKAQIQCVILRTPLKQPLSGADLMLVSWINCHAPGILL